MSGRAWDVGRWRRGRTAAIAGGGKAVQQRIERDCQHLKGRLRPLRGVKTLTGARVLCRAHAFLRNLRGRCYELGHLADGATRSPVPPVVRAWDTLTGTLLGR